MGLVLILTVVDPTSFTNVFLADLFRTEWLRGSFPDVFFTVWFCTEWFRVFPNILLAALHADLFNVFHVEPASFLHVGLIWA